MSSHMKKAKLKKANAGMAVKSTATPKPTVDSAKPKVYTPKTYVDKFGRTMKGVPPKPTTFKKGGSMKTLKKAQKGATVKATPDSTSYYRSKAIQATSDQDFAIEAGNLAAYSRYLEAEKKAKQAQARQANKGKPGYDKNGFPLSKAKPVSKAPAKKTGGTLSKAMYGKSMMKKGGSTKKK